MDRTTLIGSGLLGLGLGLFSAALFPWLSWVWPLVALLVAAMLWRRAGSGVLKVVLAGVALSWAFATLRFSLPEIGGVDLEGSRLLRTLKASEEQLADLSSAATLRVVNAAGTVYVEGGSEPFLEVGYRSQRRRARVPERLLADFNEAIRTLTITGVDPDLGERERRGLSAEFRVGLPADTTLEVISEVGDIEVSGVDKAFLTTKLGDLHAEATGDLRAFTDVGNVRVLNAEGEVDVQTNVGSIDLVFENPLEQVTRGRTKVGDITLSLPASSDVSLHAVSELRSFSGALERLTPTESRLVLGNESADVSLQTDVGTVEVRTY